MRNRVVKEYRMCKEYNPFDKKYKFVIRDDDEKLIFMGTREQTMFSFADRLKDSGHAVIIDDTVNMTDEQLEDMRQLELVAEGV